MALIREDQTNHNGPDGRREDREVLSDNATDGPVSYCMATVRLWSSFGNFCKKLPPSHLTNVPASAYNRKDAIEIRS